VLSVWLSVRDDEDVFVLAKPIIDWLEKEGCGYEFDGNFRTEADGQFMIEFKVSDGEKKEKLQEYWSFYRYVGFDS
jgi:hypothetical protein